MYRGFRLALATVVALSAFVAYASAETIRFGAILPLTGPGALIGTQQMRGLQFAMDKANAAGGVRGNKIEILFEDNQAKPDQSILSFNKLVDLQHVPLIFSAYSGPSLAMAASTSPSSGLRKHSPGRGVCPARYSAAQTGSERSTFSNSAHSRAATATAASCSRVVPN